MTQPDLTRDTGCSAALVPSSTAATQFLIDDMPLQLMSSETTSFPRCGRTRMAATRVA